MPTIVKHVDKKIRYYQGLRVNIPLRSSHKAVQAKEKVPWHSRS